MQSDPDLDSLAAALERHFPDAQPVRPLTLLGSGFHSTAVETASGIVFRVGKDAQAPDRYAVEHSVLPALGGWLPVPIPNPLWFRPSESDFPRGIISYRKIPGRPLTGAPPPAAAARLAQDLAEFLLSLHSFPADEAARLGVPRGLQKSDFDAIRARVAPLLRDALNSREYAVASAWWDKFLSDEDLWRYSPALIHGDLWYENVLVGGDERLTGVVDFDHIAIGDPAQDIAALHHAGQDFASGVLHRYSLGGGKLGPRGRRRVERLWQFREFEGIEWALQHDDADELTDSLAKLRRGPILAS